MPTYSYRCEQCGDFTYYQGIKDKPLTECPKCQAAVTRLIGKNVGVVLTGGGYYSTSK